MRLNERLKRLEAVAPPPEPPAKEITDEDCYRFLNSLFITKQIWFDDAGACVLGPVGVWDSKEFKLRIIEDANEFRNRTGVQVPVWPALHDETVTYLEHMRNGRMKCGAGGERIGATYDYEAGKYHPTHWPGYELGRCLDVYEASGGKVEWTDEFIIQLLTEIAELPCD